MSNCDHNLLCAQVKVTIYMPIAHNSAAEISRVYNVVTSHLDRLEECSFELADGIKVQELD